MVVWEQIKQKLQKVLTDLLESVSLISEPESSIPLTDLSIQDCLLPVKGQLRKFSSIHTELEGHEMRKTMPTC
jgi:hypothetical protein